MIEIYCIDDEEAVLAGLRRTFRSAPPNWTIAYYSSALEALAAARVRAPDVVVTDLNMPELGGLDLIAAMRAAAPEARYMVLSGAGDFNIALAAINEAHVFRFLAKPCPGPALVDAVSDAASDIRREDDEATDESVEAGVATLSLMATAVVVVDAETSEALFANAPAQSLLAARDGLLVDELGRVRAGEQRQTKRLRECIAAAHRGGREFLSLPRPSASANLTVAAAPLPAGRTAGGRVALLIGDPLTPRAPAPGALAKLHGLTEAEAKIALAIADGRTLTDASAEAGVTLSTARTYLKRVFAKTGVARQAELVRLILAAPALGPAPGANTQSVVSAPHVDQARLQRRA